VLGALQVDVYGLLANWMIPGKMVPGMGDIAMQHTAKGKPKIVNKCTLPLTSAWPVDLVVSERAVIGFPGGNATLLETGPGVTVDQVTAATEAKLAIADTVSEMRL
jgi:acetate CoA/acetoacetate CoA-transferase beta subunit